MSDLRGQRLNRFWENRERYAAELERLAERPEALVAQILAGDRQVVADVLHMLPETAHDESMPIEPRALARWLVVMAARVRAGEV